jgi:hypothetical protein
LTFVELGYFMFWNEEEDILSPIIVSYPYSILELGPPARCLVVDYALLSAGSHCQFPFLECNLLEAEHLQ